MKSNKIFEEIGYLVTSQQNMISPNGFMRRFVLVRIICREIRIILIYPQVKPLSIQILFSPPMLQDFTMVYLHRTQEGLEKPTLTSCFQEQKLLAISDVMLH